MLKTTKHRILGILVIIGLGIILLPLFQNNKELPVEVAVAQTPPFPDHPTQANATPQEEMKATSKPLQEAAEEVNSLPNDVISTSHPSVINHTIQPLQTVPNPTLSEKEPKTTRLTAEDVLIDSTPITHAIQKVAHLTYSPKTPKIQSRSAAKTNHHGLKNPTWVVQLGSFKNKANALRLVNQLRANGYHAFMQKTSTGHSTRVFVGPEEKRTAARTLVNRLENDVHIRGMIINYKSLTV